MLKYVHNYKLYTKIWCVSGSFSQKDPHFSTAYGAVRVELFSNQKTRSVRCHFLGSHPGPPAAPLREKGRRSKIPVSKGEDEVVVELKGISKRWVNWFVGKINFGVQRSYVLYFDF